MKNRRVWRNKIHQRQWFLNILQDDNFLSSWVMETCFPNPEFVTHISCLAYLSLFLRKPKLTVGWVANLIRLARHVWMNKISYRTSIHLFPSDFLNKSEFLGLVWECSFDAERIFLWSTFSWKQSFSGVDWTWRPVISNWAARRLWTRVIPLGAIVMILIPVEIAPSWTC